MCSKNGEVYFNENTANAKALVNRPMIDDKLFSGLYQEVCEDNKDI